MPPDESMAQGSIDLAGWFGAGDARLYFALAKEVFGGLIVEVGTWKGLSLSHILDVCRANGSRLVAVDTFTGDPEYPPAVAEASGTDIEAILTRNLALLGHANTVSILREPSVAAARQFENSSINLVFIDADHRYEAVLNDLRSWLPKVVPGGVIAGHDYDGAHPGVVRAVDEFFGDRVIKPGSGTTIWIARV